MAPKVLNIKLRRGLRSFAVGGEVAVSARKSGYESWTATLKQVLCLPFARNPILPICPRVSNRSCVPCRMQVAIVPLGRSYGRP